MDTQDLINTVLLEYGAEDDTDARADVLKWLNEAQREVWFFHNWWFRQELAVFEFQSGVRQYTIDDTTYADVLYIFDADGNPITRIGQPTWYRLYHALTQTGTPKVYGMLPRESGVPKLELWPTPSSNTSGSAIYELRVTDLLDVADNTSQIPAEQVTVLIDYAKEKMAIRGNRPQSAQLHQAARQEKLQQMLTKDAEFKQGKF